MIYSVLSAARAAMQEMNAARGHAPAAVYWDDAGNGYTVLRAWQHSDRRGLRLVLAPGGRFGIRYVTLGG